MSEITTLSEVRKGTLVRCHGEIWACVRLYANGTCQLVQGHVTVYAPVHACEYLGVDRVSVTAVYGLTASDEVSNDDWQPATRTRYIDVPTTTYRDDTKPLKIRGAPTRPKGPQHNISFGDLATDEIDKLESGDTKGGRRDDEPKTTMRRKPKW